MIAARRPSSRTHDAKVARIAAFLQARTSTAPLTLHKRVVPHQVPKPGNLTYRDEKLDISDLDEILDIDVVGRTCTAEPGVTFVDLVNATLPHGLAPIIVPELKTITIGGAVAGCSVESMSFAHGGFHDTCLEYEVVTATGEVLSCTPDNDNALVFQMMHGTFGTLGIITKLRFKLVPAKRFVKLHHEHHATPADYERAIERHFRARDVDFMDGIIHSPTSYALCLGTFVDEAPYTHKYDWVAVYFESTAQRDDDYMPTLDYYFRYDRGVTNVHPKSAVARFFVGKLVGSSQVLWLADKLHRFLPKQGPEFTLDVFVPFSKATEFLTWYERELGGYPVWCVPYRRVRDYEWIASELFHGMHDELYLDFAMYGQRPRADGSDYRSVEQELLAIGGIKTLISYNYFSEEEFWRMWNKQNYDAVKARTDPKNVFRGLYEKMVLATQGRHAPPST